MRKARAPLIALIEDVGRPDPNWAAALVKEHAQTYAAIGGAMENGIDRPLNWALYFGDFGRYQNPVPRGPSPYVSDANVCYKREALERVADAWPDSYNEARVHAALASRGEKLALSPDVIVYQHRLNLQLVPALVERYVWGRSYAAVRVQGVPAARRAVLAVLCPVLPFVLFLRQLGNVVRTKRNEARFLSLLPLTALLERGVVVGRICGIRDRTRLIDASLRSDQVDILVSHPQVAIHVRTPEMPRQLTSRISVIVPACNSSSASSPMPGGAGPL